MGSNSGKDEARNNLHDPTLRGRGDNGDRQSESNEGACRSLQGPQGLKSADAVIVRDAVERERQHQLARSSRPAQRSLRLAHPLTGTNHAPQNVGEPGPALRDSIVEPPLRIDLRAVRSVHRPSRRGPARPERRPRSWSRAGELARSQSLRSRSPASN